VINIWLTLIYLKRVIMHKFGDEPSHAQVRYGCSLLKIINLIVMDLERPWFLEFNQENICSR